MTAPTISSTVAAPENEDAALLRQLWRLTVRELIRQLESGEAKASALAVARSFLESNSVSLESLDKLEGKGPGASAEALAPMLARLPSFND